MKKIFLCLVASILLLSVTHAQDALTETDYSTMATSSSSDPEPKLICSFELDYMKSEGNNIFGGSLVIGGLVFTGDYLSIPSETSDLGPLKSWHAGIGLNKRFHIVRNKFFIEGRVGASYRSSKIEYTEGYVGSTKEPFLNENGYGLFVYPRINLALLSNTCVTAGLKYDFADFQFTSENTTKFATVGLSFLF